MNLRRAMAEHGFESNDDYEYAIRTLMAAELDHVRCLHVEGESGRRKSAFANALANALGYPRILYHDFSLPEPPPQPVFVTAEDRDNPQPVEAALSRFERVMVEACAYSEAERTFLILDQLQAADFRDQIALTRFAQGGAWSLGQGEVRANPKHLLVALIAEAPLYHSLARLSFRVWTDASQGRFEFKPRDFGLGAESQPLFDALAALFEALGSVPTPGEFRRILVDLGERVRSAEQLRQSVFGWMERADRARLHAPGAVAAADGVIKALEEWLGSESVVLADSDDSSPD